MDDSSPESGQIPLRQPPPAVGPFTTRLLSRLRQERRAVRRTGEPLTSREQEVARLVAEGLTNSEIGAELFIAAGTVKTHLARLQKKLGVQNRVGIAAWVWESGPMTQT